MPALRRDKADLDHVLLDDIANRGEQRGHVFAFHPGAAARIEYRLHLLDDKGHIAAAAEHGADHAGQRHGPGEMLHVLRVDEDLERAAAAILDDVVQGDVEGVLAVRPADLVGLAGKRLGARQRLRHVNDPARLVGIGRAPRRRRRRQWQFALARRRLAERRLGWTLRTRFQNGAGDLVRPVGRAALAAERIGLGVDIFEALKRDVGRHVDRLRDRAVDIALDGRLHDDVVLGRQGLRVDEVIGQRCGFAPEPAEGAVGVIGDLFLAATAIRHQHVAGVAEAEHRLETGGDVVGEQRNRAGRRDRGQERVADAVFGDRIADIGIEGGDGLAGEVFVAVEQREGALLGREIGRSEIGGMLDRAQPFLGLGDRRGRTIAQPAQDQRVGKAGHAEADAALFRRLFLLLRQREAGDVDDVVHQPHGVGNERGQGCGIEPGLRRERVFDKARQVQRTQQARAIGRQRLFAAGVGRVDLLAIPEIVPAVDAVDKDDARLGIGVGRAHDLVPQLARGKDLRHGLRLSGPAEMQFPGSVLLDGFHKSVGDEDGEVEHAQPAGLALGFDKSLDVGVLAGERRHHRAAAITRAHDRAAHRVPHIHEGQRARGIRADAFDVGAARPEGREIVADPAALLHR